MHWDSLGRISVALLSPCLQAYHLRPPGAGLEHFAQTVTIDPACPEVIQKAALFFKKLANGENRSTLITILTFEVTPESTLVAACVMEIFHIRDSLDHIHTLLGVRRHTSAPPNLSDAFQRHPHFK